MRDADEYGSILTVRDVDFSVLYGRYDLLVGGERPSAVDLLVKEQFLPFLRAAEMLSRQYDAVVTNPPYMGSSGMGPKLTDFVKKNYPDSKSDLFAVFIERCGEMTAENGYQAMITQHAWMFLSSFEKLRGKQQAVDTVNMAHLGARAFEEIGGEVVQTTSFVLRNTHIRAYKGTYCRLIEPTSQQGKEDMFLAGENRYAAQQDNFAKIPGAPVAYWASEAVQTAFSKYPQIDDVFETRNGMSTTNNGIFLRFWYEPALPTIGLGNYTAISAKDSGKRWFRYNKGGEFRRWYGNNDFVVNWYADGKELKEYVAERYGSYSKEIRSEDRYFYESITWSGVTSGQTGFRYSPQGAVFDSGANGLFANNHQLLMYLMGFLNTKIVVDFVKYKNPTINTGSGTVGKLPINIDYSIIDLVEEIVQRCITLSKTDWDAFETSWDFQRHPLVTYRVPEPVWGDVPDEVAWKTINLGLTFHCWEDVCQVRFDKLKANEEELNRIFIDIYGLQDELTPEVDDRDVTVRRADLGRDIRSLISYAVGCMFGRYSLNKEGLVYAGGDFNDVYWLYKGKAAIDKDGNTDGYPGISMAKYHYPRLRDSDDWETATQLDFEPDYDNVIPICDDEYFDDDIVSRFVKFVETVYGKNSLEENLNFIARALGGKGSAREVIRRYFLNDFYADHLKIYQNRPIYWLFDSGKKNGFKCLIYMHRYRPDTIARIRTDYVHEQQSRYRTAIADLEQRIAAASTADRVKLSKQLSKLQAQAEEIRVYEEKIHHLADQMISIDLDDGVKVNYAKFADVLAKIK